MGQKGVMEESGLDLLEQKGLRGVGTKGLLEQKGSKEQKGSERTKGYKGAKRANRSQRYSGGKSV